MADENNVVIEVKDGVDSSIAKKIDKIGDSARRSNTAVENLKAQLKLLDGGALSQLSSQLQTSSSNASKLNNEINKNAVASQKAALAQAKLGTEVAKTATQEQRLATETQRTATAQSNAARAATQAAAADLRLQQQKDRLAQSTRNSKNELMEFAKQALTLTAIAVGLKQALDFAEAYTIVNNKIKTVTESVGQQNTLLKELTDLSLRTSTAIDTVSSAFIRFDRPMKMMGKSQEDTIRLIETVNKELANQGATTSEAASAVLQLGQAFGSGKLQGDEFRSLAENMPTLLDAVAKVMDKPISKIKELGTEGKITSAVLLQALTDMQVKTDETFAKTDKTVAQAVTNFKTQMTIFIGELDKSLGVSATLAKGIVWVSDNLDTLAFAASVTGAALLVAFGPALLGVLGTATSAVLAFTVALASNPIGLIAVAIATTIAYIAAFGDEIKAVEGTMITLQDVALAVWDYIAEGVKYVTGLVGELWDWVVNQVISHFDVLQKAWGDTGISIVDIAKSYVNFVIGFWVAAFNVIRLTWNNFPAAMDALFTAVVNAAAGAAERVVNFWQVGFRAIAGAAKYVAPEMAEGLSSALDKVSIKLPRAKASAAGQAFVKDLGDSITSATSVDYVGKAYNAVMGKALTRAVNRSNKSSGDALRGAGKDITGAGAEEVKKGKGAKDKKGKSPTEKLTDEQKAYKKALDEIEKPLRDYNAAIKVADDLLKNGKISLERHNALITKATDEYKRATDPMYAFNKSAEEQAVVLNKVGVAAEAERQVIQARNSAIQAGLVFNDQMAEKIRATVEALDMQQRTQDYSNQIWDETVGKQKDIIAFQQAYDQALKQGLLTQEQYNVAIANRVGGELSNMGVDSSNWESQIQARLDQYQIYYDELKKMRDADRISQDEYENASLQLDLKRYDVRLNQASDFFGGLAQLQKSENKKIAAIGKAAAIVQTTIQTYQAATSAYASLAAIPYVGPVLGAAAAAAAIAAGMANVRAIKSQQAGFKTGGYTGNIGVNEVAGVVHGQEFVMNASATSKYRPMLDAMNEGKDVTAYTSKQSESRGMGGITVNIDNTGTYKAFDVQQLSEQEVRIIARDEADNAVRKKAPSVVAQDIMNANGEVSTSLSQNTRTERAR